jgi:hypothetical protein
MPKLPKPLNEWVGKCILVQIMGDAEAYLFDYDALPDEQRRALVDHHLRAFSARMKREGKDDWSKRVVPFALLGHSMPPEVRGRIDLSAPHEGVLLLHRESAGVLYCASNEDEQLAIAYPDTDALGAQETYLEDVWDPATTSFAYEVNRSECEGFTLGEIELTMSLGGAELTLV